MAAEAIDEFQFQFGAIKRIAANMAAEAIDEFQFQFGAIKSRKNPLLIELGRYISIPIWCD